MGHILCLSDHKQYQFHIPATSAIVRECPADIYDQLSYSQEAYQTALYIFLIDMCSMDVSGSYRHDDTNVYGF